MAAAGGTKKRALLVDDNQDSIDLLTLELEVLGYDVSIARNGQEAVDMATSDPPDVVIMDMLMPKMDGFEAAARIRAHPQTHNTPILAATALARDKDRDRCFASGCNDHLVKPFTHTQLDARIRKLLRIP
jgi:CheY-like chemotaxis protein